MNGISRSFETSVRSRTREVFLATVLMTAGIAPAAAEPSSHPAAPLPLTMDERAWLEQHPVVSFGVNHFPPLIFSAHDGSPTGIGAEYSELIAARLGVKLKWVIYPSWGAELDALRAGQLDVAPTMANRETPEGLRAGQPWMFLKGVIVTRRNARRIAGIEDLSDQIVAAQRISPGEMEIKRRFPKQKLLVTESVPEILDAVVTGKAAAGIGMLAIVDYSLRNEGYGDSLKLAAPFGEQDVPVRMLVGKDALILSGILDKGIATVSDVERQEILQHWFTTSIDQGIAPARVLRLGLTVALPGLAALAFLLYWALRLRREVRWRKALQVRAQAQAEALKLAKAELDQALKRTSGQFQAILDNAPMAIWAKDSGGHYLFANQCFRQMFIAGDRAIVGERDETIFSNTESEKFRANDQTVIRDQSPRTFIEPVVRYDGRRQRVLTVKFPLFDDKGQVYAAAGICADISDQIALQEELQRLNQELAAREQQLLRISRSPVVDAGDLYETWKLVTSAACAGLDVRRASIWFWDAGHEALICQFLLDREKGPSEELTLLARRDFPRYFAALGAGRAILAHDANTDSRTAEFSAPYLQPLGITSMLDVAIRHGGSIVGVFCCEHVGPARKWREEEGFFASALADLVGRALTAESRARAETEVKELLATLEQRVAERTVEAQQARAVAEASRRRVLDITDSVPGVVFEYIRMADGSHSAPFVSGGMKELVGLSGEAVLEDVDRYFALVLPEDAADYKAAIDRSAELGCDVRHCFRIRHATTGEIRWLAVHALPPHRDDGRFNWRGYIHDITEQKELEDALGQALQRAQSAERAKGEFLANMSHEIRTPMNAIIGMSHLVQQTKLAPRQLNYVTKIDAAAKSLLGIINDILDFSKIEAGKLTLENMPFSLQKTLDNLTTMIGQKAEQKGLELLFDIDPRIPDALIGDPVRLAQILINLCSNAVKFTDAGEVVVTAQPLKPDGNEQMIRFTVRDSGIGMTPDQVARLFRPFEQADASTTRKHGGTGLGLTIARRICEMMSGSIGVTSEVDHGSTFWFTVRLGIGQPASVVPTSSIDGLRILIVDDNAAAREILVSLATSLKLLPTAVASGEEAVAALRHADPPFNIVLADWKMPGMSGVQLAHAIRGKMKLARSPLVILVTAYGSEDLLQDLGELECDGVLTKPLSASMLLDTIQQRLGEEHGLPPRQARRAATEITPDFRGARVLLVEDNDVNREVAQEILGQTGASVTVAINGQEAVAAIAPGRFDVVLMDVQMPVMDGEEATRILRLDPALKDLPIIAMTASAMVGDRERFFAAGMNDHVIKPIDVPELFAVLKRWITPRADDAAPGTAAQKTTTAAPPEHPPIPDIAGIDVAQGLKRVGGNAALYLRILKKFGDNHADAAARIRAALDHNDHDTAAREAHTLTGTSGTIGATALFVAAREVESACRARTQASRIGLQVMETTLATLIAAISKALDHAPDRPAPKAPPPTVDRAQIERRIRELKLRLDEYDAAARDTLDALRALVGNDSRIEQVGRHLDRYDFAAASAAMEPLARDFGIGLETAS